MILRNFKSMRDTIQDMNLSTGRRTGKSIRQIDKAVQILFEDGEVKILDHHEDGSHKAANNLLLRRIVKRLESEHSSIVGRLEINEDKLTIKIKL